MSRSALTPRPRRNAHHRTATLIAAAAAGVLALAGGRPAQALSTPEAEGSLPAETLNGTPASLTAVLRPVTPQSVRRAYAHSALQIKSRLVTLAGQPIASASVDILEQVAGSQQKRIVGHATTREDGTVLAGVPAGPSRTVYLAYRPLPGAPYTAQTEMFETVTAGLWLTVTPMRTTPTGTVVFHGRILGTIPPKGVIVELLVYYQGVWQPIRTPRSKADGRITLRYRFHRALGSFPFRVRIREGQEGFPYGEASSPWVDVVAHEPSYRSAGYRIMPR